MSIFHITLTAERETRLPLFPDEHTYLEALHRLGAACGGCLALFALIAEHLHLVALASRLLAGRLARAVQLTLRPIVATPLAPSHFQPVASRSHMRWLLRYILEQPRDHGMPGHPALWIGSCLPDLLGARRIEGLSLAIERALPDYTPAAAMRIVGLPGSSLEIADRSTLRAAGADRLRIATAAALGANTSLEGNTLAAIRGRQALAQLAKRVGIHRAEVIATLGINPRSTWRLARPAAERDMLAAIARRVELENLVQEGLQRPRSLEPGLAALPPEGRIQRPFPKAGLVAGRSATTRPR